MLKDEVKTLLDYLVSQSEKYDAPGAKKKQIEQRVRNYPISDDLLIILNEDTASGLFEPGFFETDLDRSIKKLKVTMND